MYAAHRERARAGDEDPPAHAGTAERDGDVRSLEATARPIVHARTTSDATPLAHQQTDRNPS